LSKHAAYAPKHRGTPDRPLAEAPKKAARATLVLSLLAVGGTGATVAGGVVLTHRHGAQSVTAYDAAAHTSIVLAPATPAGSPATSASSAADRTTELSRSYDRAAVVPTKAASLAALSESDDTVTTQSEDLAGQDPQSIASALLSSYGWSGSQFGCLVSLWNRESNWNVHAANPSGAYGIPQSLPGSKMASAGPDWQDNAETQIKWGLGYIKERYGSPCGAWGHSEAHGWY
jgi:hypothetical protein